jgi:hypothetical protein
MTIRGHCEGLLGAEDYWRYRELCDKDVFNYDVEENRLTDWKILLDKLTLTTKMLGQATTKVKLIFVTISKTSQRSCVRG